MVTRIVGACLLASVMGCAGQSQRVDAPNERSTSRSSAARMYQAAEYQAELGRYDDAIRLVRHSILALDPAAHDDALRHRLVLRMAHLQMQAADAYHEPAFALDAANMLLAYGERHGELFGEEKEAERTAVYEMLYEAETLAESLSAPPPKAEPASAPIKVATASVESPGSADDHAGEELEAEMTRNVRVRKGWFYDPDDPRIRQRLESALTDPFGNVRLTSPEPIRLPPAPLVRQVGLAKATAGDPGNARRLGRQVLRAARPQLRECYARAAARGGVLETEAVVEFTVDAQGGIERSAVVSGDVVDGIGDACVIEKLDAVALEDRPEASQRVQVTMLFFYDNAKWLPGSRPEDISGGEIDPSAVRGKSVSKPGINSFSEPTRAPVRFGPATP